jgi:hypothetical protein
MVEDGGWGGGGGLSGCLYWGLSEKTQRRKLAFLPQRVASAKKGDFLYPCLSFYVSSDIVSFIFLFSANFNFCASLFLTGVLISLFIFLFFCN